MIESPRSGSRSGTEEWYRGVWTEGVGQRKGQEGVGQRSGGGKRSGGRRIGVLGGEWVGGK